MRGTAASRHPLLGAGDFPLMPERRFRCWADELPSAAARSRPARPWEPKKKRSVSDLFASASTAAAAADTEVDGTSCAIKKRAKTMNNRLKKLRSQEDEDRIKKAHLGRRSSEENQDGEIFGSTPKAKIALNKFDPPNSAQTSMITEREQHIKIQNGKINDVERMKPKRFKNLKNHKLKYTGGTKAINAQILRNSANALPFHSILKKYTKHSSVSINKEKCNNSKGPEVIEVCHKLVKNVTFSRMHDILSSNQQNFKLPQLQNLCNVFSDVLATSSSLTDNSSQSEEFIAADSGAYKNKETSFETNQSDRNISDGSSESSSRKLPPGLIDLNRALPDLADFNYPSISDSEFPNLKHAKDATCDSDFQILGDERETVLKYNQDLPFNSQPVQCELSIYDRGRIIDSKSAVSLLPHEATNIPDTEMVSLPLNSRGEFIKFYGDYQRSSVRDSKMKGKAPCALPHHKVQYSIQRPQNCYTNLNQGNFHTTGKEFSCCLCPNLLHAEKPRFHSDMNVQPEHANVVGHTVRLMGKDLTVSSTRSKCIGKAAKEHVGPSIRCHHTTEMFLELP